MEHINFINNNDTIWGVISHYNTDDGIDNNQCNLNKSVSHNVEKIAFFFEVPKHDLTLALRILCCDITYPHDDINIDMRINIRI